jgi:hypothetical protein
MMGHLVHVDGDKAYGAIRALEISTTVKLTRALWIVPVTLVVGSLWKNDGDGEQGKQKVKRPWFILGFLAAAYQLALAFVTSRRRLQGQRAPRRSRSYAVLIGGGLGRGLRPWASVLVQDLPGS